jgi:hypothetical protein
LSDGTDILMPPDASIDDWEQAQNLGETGLDQKYMAQAKAQNAPVTTKEKVYSATAARPAGPYSHLMAWIDHNLGGNAINANPTAQAINRVVAPGAGVASRVGTAAIERNPWVAAADLGATGYNVAKHLAGKVLPAINNVPDSQTILGLTRAATGTPELDPKASSAQRVLENAASVSLNPSSWTRPELANNVARAGASYLGGEAGGYVGGEAGQVAGSVLGGAHDVPANVIRRGLAPFFRSPLFPGQEPRQVGGINPDTTRSVSDAMDRVDIQPTAGAVSNSMGRLFDKVIGATPFVGTPVRSAQERFNNAIRTRQLEVAADRYGGPLPGDIGKEDIGDALIRGARQGAANITKRAGEEQNQMVSDVGPSTPVDARGVYYGPAGYEHSLLTMPPNEYQAYKPRLDNIRDAAVNAQRPIFQNFWGVLAAGEVPFAMFQALRSSLGADIPGFSGMSKGQQDQLYGAMTDAMRDAAFQRGGQRLADQFDVANANYKRLIGEGGQREALEKIGGTPQSGNWGQFSGQPGGPANIPGGDFKGGKDEGSAYTWFNSKMRSPQALAPFADPTIMPHDFWREVVGQWLARAGLTDEGTYRPDKMAKEWSGPQTGVGGDVRTQMFSTPGGGVDEGLQNMNDLATGGRNAVVPINRSGLTDIASTAFGWKWLLDQMKQIGGHTLGGATSLIGGRQIANAWANPEWANTIRGQPQPFLTGLYEGVPAATQNIMQAQTNPPEDWGVLAGRIPLDSVTR